MEVVGKRAAIPQSSAWTTPLTFSDHDQPARHLPSVMQTNSSHRISANTPSTTSAPHAVPRHSHSDLPSSHPDRGYHSGSSSSLVRSESAPINILEETSASSLQDSEFASLSVSAHRNDFLESDFPHASFSHPMNFAAVASAGTQNHQSVTSSLSPSRLPQGQRKPPQPGSNKPPPSRSLSSVELAAIVNGAQTPGVGAVPARLTSSSNGEPAASAAAGSSRRGTSSSLTAAGTAGKGKKSAVPAWHKSVFDMIQDDFPKTPAPMFSSMLASTRAAGPTQDGSLNASVDGRATSSERRARLASTASLDLDLDRIGIDAEPANEVKAFRKAGEDQKSRDGPSRSHHRRSVSINWTGDLPGLGTDISRTSSRPNLASSPSGSGVFSGKHSEAPPVPSPSSSVVTRAPTASVTSLPAAVAVTGSPPPAQSLSPAESVQRPTVPIASSRAVPPMSMPGHVGHSIVQGVHGSQHHLGHYPLPNPGPVSTASGSVDEMNVPGLADYDYLYDQGDSSLISGSNGNPMHGFPNQGFSGPPGTIRGGSGFAPGLGQHIGSGSQYANVFPGMGLFPSPFSSGSAGVGNSGSVGPGYNETFRDGMSAADDLKNMSIQMAAFLNAQQQLYAAQMAQMAAITGSSGFSGNLAAFANTMPGRPPAQVGSNSHLRSSWDVRDPSGAAQRNMPRSKHHFDQYRGGGSHISNQKKHNSLDLGHKNRGGRSRRGHRAHDEVALAGHKSSDRTGMGSGSIGNGLQESAHTRSPLLEEFRATSLSIGRSISSVGDLGISGGYGASNFGQGAHNGREWQLSEIAGNVVEFATDQHGSRFIQQKLESASVQDKDSILRHALTDAQRLMTDVFGNYVVQKLLDHGGDNAVKLIAAELEGRMLNLSLHMYGCRVVQKALEVLESGARATLVRELDGHVLKCIRDQNGNHVIQKCVELVEPDAVQFIVDSVQGQAVVLAGHSYGCRVVQRILEHGAPSQKAPIMLEIMSCIADLIKDQYGNYVIQHVVEHGTVSERSIIMNLVRDQVCQLSQHKFASNVVERCLQHGSMEERQILIEILIVGDGGASASPLNHLVRDQFGNYVVQRVLDVARPPQRERVVTILRAQVPAIKKYSYGKHIIARLEEHQGSFPSNAYHHVQNVPHHVAGGHSGIHRGERHVRPQAMSVGTSHSVPQTAHDYMYYE